MKLEEALAKTDSDAEETLRAATFVVKALKKFRSAAQAGNIRDLPKAIEVTEQAITALRQQFANAKEGWFFDEAAYFSEKSFLLELIDEAEKIGVKIFEQDDILYCYPVLIRLLPNEQSVKIDKTRERRIRPSVLAKHLKKLQNKPMRFTPEAFLECLQEAYLKLVGDRRKKEFDKGTEVKLLDIYSLLTLLPGQSKEYSLHEFARDIYLLDRSRIIKTKKGLVVRFIPPSTKSREKSRSIITVITQEGEKKMYYLISFAHE
jgi:hypothetical protein